MRWNAASSDWHCPRATNVLQAGGTFSYRMEAKDASEGFDLNGVFTEVTPFERLRYKLDDGRAVEVHFQEDQGHTTVVQSFEPESKHSEELQRSGWQAILDNFKQCAEMM